MSDDVEKRKPGHPTVLTAAVREKLTIALQAGSTRAAAAAYAGIAEITLRVWYRKNREIRLLVNEAESKAEVGYVAVIAKAAQSGDWRAAAFWLERRRNEDWGRHDRIEIVRAVRELARASGLDADEEEEAVREVERMIRDGTGTKPRSGDNSA